MVLGHTFWDLFDVTDGDRARASFAGGTGLRSIDVACPSADGSTHRLRFASTLVPRNEGDLFVLTGFELAGANEPPGFEASARFWEEVVDHASWGIAIGSLDGKFLTVNEAFARMHGTTRSALVGTAIAGVFAPSSREGLADRFSEIHEKGSSLFTADHIRGDGSVFPVLVDATAVRDPNGNVVCRAVYVQDMTARVLEERAWRALFEQASDGIFIADLDGRYTDVNTAGCKMLGYDRAELVGKSIVDLIAADQVERLDESKARMLRGETDLGEWILRRADGTFLPVELTAKILPDGRWQAFVRDITERKRTAEVISASELKFRQIVSVAADAIISVDEDQRIVLFNEGAVAMFGHPESEVLGRPIEMLLPERYRNGHRAHMTAFLKGDSGSRPMAERRPIRALRRGDEEFDARASISRLVDRGRTIGTIVLHDVSAEVRAFEEEHLLADVSEVLAESLNIDVAVERLCHLGATRLAESCMVEVVLGDGRRIVRVGTRDPRRATAAAELERVALAHERSYPGAAVWDSGVSVRVDDVTDEHLRAHARRDDESQAIRGLGPRSIFALPMQARGHLIGVLSLFSDAAVSDDRDERIAAEVANRAAIALDNASLHEALVRAHAELGVRVRELQEAQERIQTLKGLLPVCAWCGQIRDDAAGGTWKRFDQYIAEHSVAEVTHGICPTCTVTVRTR